MNRTARTRSLAGVLGMLLTVLAAVPALATEDVTPPAPATAPPTPLVPEPVTLSARNLDIQEVLAMLSRSRDLNIICGPDVQGTVSIELREVPFTEALQAVVAMAGMEVTRRGNIYFVRRPAGDDPAATALCEARSFRLDYAQPDEVQSVIEQILSPAGRVMSYAPRRTLVVEDRPEVLERVDAVLRTLDVAPRQVMIEARILEARLGRDMQFGIDWSLLFSNAEHHGDGLISIEGFAAEPNTGAGPGAFASWTEGDFMGAIQSLEGVETLNTLASPRLLAVDGADARIIIGGQLGFFVTTTVENTILQSVQFIDTGTQLRITPTIAGDGFVRMTIHPELSDGAIDNGLPSKTTTEVTTEVLIRDGQTLLIGGLIREREEVIRKGIPVLMHLPVLGRLFGSTNRSLIRSELIALITPHVIPTGGDVPYEGIGMVGRPLAGE